MHLIRGLQNLKEQPGCVLTIGNFDGIHRGHQKIIKALVAKANTLGVPSIVISFSVPPESFFGRPKARLSSFRDKHLFLESLGVEKHLLIRFNKDFSQMSAQSFVEDVLLAKLKMRCCFIGDDFRFGKDRQGDYSMLENMAKTCDFVAQKVNRVTVNGKRVSSSEIRELLRQGEFSMAEELLGRPFAIEGRIMHGEKRGRTIGFPTINISIGRKLSPVLGVFAVLIELNKKTYHGVCNVGKRPTIGGEKILLEVNIFDFDKNVYGEHAKVLFRHRIREEMKFESVQQLQSQIASDADIARRYFACQ
jgi:riboflavin kinase/FMN adenylyltransferase